MMTDTEQLKAELRKVSNELVSLKNSRSRLTWANPNNRLQIKKLSVAIREKTKVHNRLRQDLQIEIF